MLAEGRVRSRSRFLTEAKGSGFVGLGVDAGLSFDGLISVGRANFVWVKPKFFWGLNLDKARTIFCCKKI
jgi:hypothetical protein